jgi:hypothetical protein
MFVLYIYVFFSYDMKLAIFQIMEAGDNPIEYVDKIQYGGVFT